MPKQKRAYDNRLRAGRAEQTRAQILDALCEELSDGSLTELSVARIAKRAGVSEPTVYRHFPNRASMFNALGSYVKERTASPPVPQEAADLSDFAERLFIAFDDHRELVRGMMAAQLGREWTAGQRAQRTEQFKGLLDEVTEGLDERDARAAGAVIRYLQSSRAWIAFADEYGMDGAEAGAACSWATRVLMAEIGRMKARAKRRADGAGTTKTKKKTKKNANKQGTAR